MIADMIWGVQHENRSRRMALSFRYLPVLSCFDIKLSQGSKNAGTTELTVRDFSYNPPKSPAVRPEARQQRGWSVRVFDPRRICLSLFLLSLVVFSTAALANDYYVSPSGSDSNPGTQAQPWKTLQHAQGAFTLGTGGTTIHVAAGSYGSSEVDITRGGSSTTVRLVIQCDPGVASATAAIGQCKFNGSWQVTGNNIDIVGFDIGNNPNISNSISLVCTPLTNVACPSGNSVHVIGNYVHDIGANLNTGGGVAGCPGSGMIALNNQHGHTMTDLQALRNIVLRYGTYPNSPCNQAQGIYASSPAIIENNIVGAIPVGGITTSFPCNSVISNNIVFSTKDAIILSGIDTAFCPGGVPGHLTIANNYLSDYINAFFNVSGTSMCTSSTPNLYSRNIVGGGGTTFNPGRSSCETVSPASLVQQAPTSFFVNYKNDAGGANAFTGDYHLKAGSAGIGAGSTSCVSGGLSPCAATTDFAGVARLTPPSIGAFEVSQSSSLPNPPTGLTALVQ